MKVCNQRFPRAYGFLVRTLSIILSSSLLAAFPVWAQDGTLLVDDYPERYTVVKGDTLWDISNTYLRDPWRWPEIWQSNPQVEDPDLIYPGDVLVLTMVDGAPTLRALRSAKLADSRSGLTTVKLSPTVRAEPRDAAIPPIDPAAIQPYIDSPLVTDSKELTEAGYIVEGFDNRLLMGRFDQFYARGLSDQAAEQYRIFRPGRHFIDPETGESLGFEAIHVGDAKMMASGDPARLEITRGHRDTTIRDRLRPVTDRSAMPFFYPSAPDDASISGVILEMPNRSTELGALSVIAINLGEREGLKAGNVLKIFSQGRERVDPVQGGKYLVPEEEVGLAMVFRTFEKVSYALVTDSSRQVVPGDRLRSPRAP